MSEYVVVDVVIHRRTVFSARWCECDDSAMFSKQASAARNTNIYTHVTYIHSVYIYIFIYICVWTPQYDTNYVVPFVRCALQTRSHSHHDNLLSFPLSALCSLGFVTSRMRFALIFFLFFFVCIFYKLETCEMKHFSPACAVEYSNFCCPRRESGFFLLRRVDFRAFDTIRIYVGST